MAKVYSQDLRERLIGAVEAGHSASAASRVFGVSRSIAIKWVQSWRRTGAVPRATARERYRWRLDAHEAWLLSLVAQEPDLTLEEIRERLADERDGRTCVNSLWRFYDRHKVVYKKTVLADEQQRPDVAAARQKWRAEQHRLDPERIVFLDETWAKTNMVRSHGRCPKGHRLAGSAPFGHWRTTTFVAGLRHDGIIAPLVMDCPMNGLIFQMYVRECLAPELRPGDTVIMDNLGSHKSQAVRDSIMEQGAYLLFLPPYSPDLNPIENFFSKLKALLRAAKERTLDDLWSRIGVILKQTSPQECRNFIRHADRRNSNTK